MKYSTRRIFDAGCPLADGLEGTLGRGLICAVCFFCPLPFPVLSLKRAFFFDRDGVVNVCPGEGYVLSWEGFRFSTGVVAALAWLKARDYVLILVTNQQGVGKGLMTQEELNDIHARMQAELEPHGAAFDGVYACTCLASDPDCTCRKPSPEMILLAAREHELDPAQSWMIGDQDRDIQMAANAGVPNTIRVLGDRPATVQATHVVKDTRALPELLAEIIP